MAGTESIVGPILGSTLTPLIVDRRNLPDDRARGKRLFRLAEYVGVLFVDATVREACEAAGIDALDFVPADEWVS